MGDAAPGYPAWILRSLFLTALGLLLAAALLWLVPAARHGVLAVHCLINAGVLYAVWITHRAESGAAPMLPLVARLTAFGFGIIDLVLAGHAALDFKLQNAVLLPLAVAGVVGWIALDLDDHLKKNAAATAAEDEAVLADTNAAQSVEPVGDVVRAGGRAALFLGLYWAAILTGVALGAGWYTIVWLSVDGGYVFNAGRVLDLLRVAVMSNASYSLTMAGAFAVIVLVMVIGGALLGRIIRKVKRPKPDDLSAEQQAHVETCLRAVWDYANRPDRKNTTFPVLILPFLLFGGALAGFIGFATYDDEIALQFAQARHLLPGTWYVFSASTTGVLFVMFGAAMVAWSLWHFIVDRWPGAPEAVMTMRYRRKGENVGIAIATLRCSLRQLVKKGGGASFDPREYFLASRRRSGRWLYGISAVAVVAAVWGVWAGLNSYTLLTPDGIADVSGFSGANKFYPYSDVHRVDIACTLNDKGDTQFHWRMVLAGGREVDAVMEKDLAGKLPGLLTVDAILRGQGTVFATRDTGAAESNIDPECLDKLAANLPDKPGFMRLMHQD